MRQLTLLYGALVVLTLSIASLLIGTIDIVVAMACGFGADLYVIFLSRQKEKMFVGSRFAPLMLVAVVPAVTSCCSVFLWLLRLKPLGSSLSNSNHNWL